MTPKLRLVLFAETLSNGSRVLAGRDDEVMVRFAWPASRELEHHSIKVAVDVYGGTSW
jgi:hypothetical protein